MTDWADSSTLKPVFDIPTLDGKGYTKRISVSRAKDLELLPRVTSIISDVMGESWGLRQYNQRNCILAAEAWRREDGETDDEYVERMQKEAFSGAREARDRGKEVHAEIENFLRTGVASQDPAAVEACRALQEFFTRIKAEGISCEHSIGGRSKGYCGTPDIFVEKCDLVNVLYAVGKECYYLENWEGSLILDVKTTDLRKFKKPYETWCLQCGGYGDLRELGKDSLYVIFLVDPWYADTRFCEIPDPERWKTAFQHLFEAWVSLKDYDPRC